MEERVSVETKLLIARELVASYVRGEAGKAVSPDELGPLFKKVYDSVNEAFPEPEKRRIGLGS